MILDATWLMLSLIPSGIGFVLFVYAAGASRCRRRAPAALYYAVQGGW
jgi:hypothetical protein